MARRRTANPHYLVNLGLSLAVLGVFGVTGLQIVNKTSAATANPYGYADYCALENNTTVIYGWAADPNAGSLSSPWVVVNAGGKSVTAPTNRAGYRDAAVNAWIDQNRAGDPKPGTYGFRAAISGLNKGSHNTITGSVLNEGAGSSVILTINNNSHTDGDTSKPFFPGNVIPDACLAGAPTPPSPPPGPVATPPRSPAPAAPSTPPAAPAPALAAENNAVVTRGTLAAELKVPAGNASNVRINYGKNPVKLDQSTADQPVSGADISIMLTGLDAATSYAYQIVRSNSTGKSTTSPIAKFDTLGFIIALHFVDNRDKGVQGIPATISVQDKNKTSDDDGNVQFTAVPAGNHTVTYTYRGKKYSKPVAADASVVSPAESSAASVVTVDYSINIEEVAASKPAGAVPRGSDGKGTWAAILLGLVALGLIIFALHRRRKRGSQDFYDSPPPPLPEYQLQSPISVGPAAGPRDQAAHTGESLKQMVLRSMAEEARRRQDEDNK